MLRSRAESVVLKFPDFSGFAAQTFSMWQDRKMNSLDKYDCAILAALQADATLSISGLSEKVGLSSTPCWKRVKRLEEEGYIESRVSIINRNKVGLPVTVFVSVRTTEHDEKWLTLFAAAVI